MKWFNLVNFLINNPCEDPNVLKIILFIRKIMEIAFIAIPIVLIVLITFDFIKSVMANSEDAMKKNQKIVIKRLFYAVMLFFVMPIVNLAFSAFDNSGNISKYSQEFDTVPVNYLTCWTNADSIKTINRFEVKVKFDGNGGTVYGEKTKTCGGSYSCDITSLPRASKKGEKFKGWSLNSTCQPVMEDSKITVMNTDPNYEYPEKEYYDLNLYACYSSEDSGEQQIDDGNGDVSFDYELNGEASGFWWPIGPGEDGKPVSTSITMKPYDRSFHKEHLGIDINSNEKKNVPIIAAYDGVVYKMENYKANTFGKLLHYGTQVILQHEYKGKIYYSIYAHMVYNSIPDGIVKGTKVKAGTKLGIMGNTGNSSGVHLHFEIREGSISADDRAKTAKDPLDFVSSSNPYPIKKTSADKNMTLKEELYH